jgi:proteic killer suppression protein
LRIKITLVIVSFRCAETERIFNEKHSRRFDAIQRVAFRKLVMLHAANALGDLAGVGNSLEALAGDRKGQHAIRVNSQYRLCFAWADRNAEDVEIVDYH